MITKGRQGWIISSFKYDFPHSWSLAQTAPPNVAGQDRAVWEPCTKSACVTSSPQSFLIPLFLESQAHAVICELQSYLK